MKIIENLSQWREIRKKVDANSIGFVPTMGALHDGHASLLKRSKEENSLSVLSIYVNPTQFDEAQDLQSYPQTWDQDVRLAENLGIDFLLRPQFSEIYADNYRFKVSEENFSKTLCGAHRTGHFTGVLTIVLKLLQLVRADRAYFGEKDYQQYLLIRDMAQSFFLETEIIPCPIVREEDGLAMSSRNLKLSNDARSLAPQFYQTLKKNIPDQIAIQELEKFGFSVDYIQTVHSRRLGAVRIGPKEKSVRLIDNVEL